MFAYMDYENASKISLKNSLINDAVTLTIQYLKFSFSVTFIKGQWSQDAEEVTTAKFILEST
jgi:hypothetical protein